MSRRFRSFVVGSATLLCLAGCSTYIREQRPPWRTQAENACLARNVVQETSSLRASPEISGPGICGLVHPFKVTALADGAVTMNSTATLDCSMISALDTWIREVVQPAAQARFGEPVVRINSIGSYSCRGINNMSGASLSEHSFGNAIDIGGFVLASGRELNVMRGFNGADEQEQAFLHEAHAGACGYFTTVLGPGYNIFHYNHFHIDLAMHGSTSRGPRRYCKPVPQNALPEPPKRDNLPDPPPIEEEMDIARAPLPAPSLGFGGPSLVASAPPAVSANRAAAYTPVPRPPGAVVARASDLVRPRAGSPPPPPLVTFADINEAPPPPPMRISRETESVPPRRPFARLPTAPKKELERALNEQEAPEAGDPQAIGRMPDGEADQFATDPVPGGTEPASRATRRAPRETPTEGSPADWDLTSLVK